MYDEDYHQKENISVKSVFVVFSSRKSLNVSSQIAVKVTLRKIAGKRKKTDNTQKSKNVGPKIVFNYPAHWFVYILIPGKKEWVLL